MGGGSARARARAAHRAGRNRPLDAITFEVGIREAHEERLSLVAHSPASIGADYDLAAADGGSDVRASVSLRGSGLLGLALARAFQAVLAADALREWVARIARELDELEPALAT